MKNYLLATITLFMAIFAGWQVQSAEYVKAVESNYNANVVASWCSQHSDVCKKMESRDATQDKKFVLFCPDNQQTIKVVAVHAGDGQTVYNLPHYGFSYDELDVNGFEGVRVWKTAHQHDISWVVLECETPISTPTPTPTPTATPTPTPTPTATPTPTPTATPTATPTPTPTPEPSEEPTPTPEPTVEPTPTPTEEPKDNDDSEDHDDNENEDSDNDSSHSNEVGGISDSSENSEGQVLGATTYAETGTFTEAAMAVVGLEGVFATLAGTILYARKKSE